MARNRSRRRERDAPPIARRFEPVRVSVTPLPTHLVAYLRKLRSPLLPVEDRRTFHPEGHFRPARTLAGIRSSLTVADRRPSRRQVRAGLLKMPMQTKAAIAFADARRVVVCVRRKSRREVLAAMKKLGAGGSRRRRRSWTSEITCR
jgi:hypothetical protein